MKGCRPKEEIGLWEDRIAIKVRSYVPLVKQCYKCFRFGHIKTFCKSEERCIICGEKAHKDCDKPIKCRNCKENHRSSFKEEFKIKTKTLTL